MKYKNTTDKNKIFPGIINQLDYDDELNEDLVFTDEELLMLKSDKNPDDGGPSRIAAKHKDQPEDNQPPSEENSEDVFHGYNTYSPSYSLFQDIEDEKFKEYEPRKPKT